MAIASTHIWGRLKGFLYELFQDKVRMKRVSIAGFTTYATNGVTYDIAGGNGFTEADTTIILEDDATYSYAYDKANNKIKMYVNATGAEVANLFDISGVTVYCTLIGK